jgi:hemolysin activation/secretion protein
MSYRKNGINFCSKFVLLISSAVTGLLYSSSSVFAAGPVLPDTGTILQLLAPLNDPPPAPMSPWLIFKPSSPEPVRAIVEDAFLLKKIDISGNSLFETSLLQALAIGMVGKNVRLSQLNELTLLITDFYRDRGYPLTRTIIPAQTIDAGVLTIQVIEARYGKIEIENKSNIQEKFLNDTLQSLQSGMFIEELELDRTLLMIGDIPGIVVTPNLKRGSVNATSDLLVLISPVAQVNGNISFNNYGNDYTGVNNFNASAAFNNPFNHGDILGVNALSSGQGMDYQSISYDIIIDGHGTHVGSSFSSLNYQFKKTLVVPEGKGIAKTQSIWLKKPLIRSRNKNLYGQFKVDRTLLKDHLETEVVKFFTDRQTESMAFSFSGDSKNQFITEGLITWNLDASFGDLNFVDADAKDANNKTSNTSGSYSKLNATLIHIENLSKQSSLVLGFKGQWASKNLDTSLKMAAGGPFAVRAYASGIISGDEGFLINAEYKHQIGNAMGGTFNVIAFIDYANLTINKRPWNVSDMNTVTVSGAGFGLTWTGPNRLFGSAYVSSALGDSKEVGSNTKNTQFAIEIQQKF